MIARLISLGSAIGISAVLVLACLPATAGQAGAASFQGQSKRFLFRPVAPAGRQHASGFRWRPPRRNQENRVLSGVTRGYPNSVRSVYGGAAPLLVVPQRQTQTPRTVGYDDARFRPRVRAGGESTAGSTSREMRRLHARFRPSRLTKRKRYEDTAAGQQGYRIQEGYRIQAGPYAQLMPRRVSIGALGHPWGGW